MSSPLLSLAQTPMQEIYHATCLDIVKELSSGMKDELHEDESFTSKHGLDKSVIAINYSDSIDRLIKKYHNKKIKNIEDGSRRAYDVFKSTMEIMKVGDRNMSINQAFDIAKDLKESIGVNFYGILLMHKTKLPFNPLHPIILHSIIHEKDKFDTNTKEYTIAVFTFNDNAAETMRKKYPDSIKEADYISEIAEIHASSNCKSNIITKNINFEVEVLNNRFVLEYEKIETSNDTGEIIESNNDSENYLIPNQIINVNGIGYPYYGTTYSRKGLAWNITPMSSANINHPFNQTEEIGMESGSRICTHSGDSRTKIGLSALNHCNTTSPLNINCMEAGSLIYASQAVHASLELIYEDKFKPLGAVKKRMTFKEFSKANKNATKRDYLEYIRDTQPEPEENETENIIESGREETVEPWDAEQTYLTAQAVKRRGIIFIATRDSRGFEPIIGSEYWEIEENEEEEE